MDGVNQDDTPDKMIVAPHDWSFFDGRQTVSLAAGGYNPFFSVGTGNSSNIFAWNLDFRVGIPGFQNGGVTPGADLSGLPFRR